MQAPRSACGIRELSCRGLLGRTDRVQSTPRPRAVRSDYPVAPPLAFSEQKHQKKRGVFGAKAIFEPTAQALDQIANDAEAPCRLQPPGQRTIVRNDAVDHLVSQRQLDLDLSSSAVEARMPR